MIWILTPILMLYIIFISIAPKVVERQKNKVSHAGPYVASSKATALFNSFDFVADLHSDALLWKRNLTKESDLGHVDFPRMQKGNMALQAFTIVTKSPKGQNFTKNESDAFDNITPLMIGQARRIKTWFSLKHRALDQCRFLHKYESNFPDFMVIKSKSDLQALIQKRQSNRQAIGGFLGVEGGHCLEGDIDALTELYDAGVRMLGPTHFFDNEMGGSAHGITGEGLSTFGFDVLHKMEKYNMILDVAHSSEAIIDDVLSSYGGPIVTSHTGVKGTVNSPRNLSDAHLKQIAGKGGLIGIGYFPGAIGNNGIVGIVQAMKYTKDLIGAEYVALGSDFDGSVTTPFDVTGVVLLVDEMINQGFSNQDIKLIMGENVKAFMLKHLPE